MKRWQVAVLILPVMLGPAWPADDGRPPEFPRGEETCFGRTYDAAHLKAHPKQTVTRFFLWNELTPDPLREDGDETGEEKRAYDLDPDGGLRLTLFLHRRNHDGMEIGFFECGRMNDGGIFCGIECDGGYFDARVEKGAMTVFNKGFILEGVCEGGPEYLEPGDDDRVFRLDSLPRDACLAERERGRPSLAEGGPRLSETLDGELDACYERTYDDAHLGRNPKQSVARIWLRKTGGNFFIGVSQRDGKTFEAAASCGSNTYGWSCSNPTSPDIEKLGPGGSYLMPSPVANIARDSVGVIRLTNHRNHLARLLGLKLGAGDDVFKLSLAGARSCGRE